MMPFTIIRTWIFGLLGIAIVLGAGYLAWDWYRYDRDDEQLWWALGLGALAFLGRFPLMLLMGFGGGPPPLSRVDAKRIRMADGTEIHVNVLKRGRGPSVVLTHGWSLDSSIWGYAQRELPEDCELLAWDLRGLGSSSTSPANDYSLETMAGDLLEVTKLANGRPVVLVGHSIGGMICQTFCRLYPGQLGAPVCGIVLCDTTFTNPLATAIFAPLWRALQKPLIEPLLHLTVWCSPLVRLMNMQSYWNGTTHQTTRLTSFAGKQSWGDIDLVSRLSSFANPAVVARGMLAMLRFDEQATLPRINVPVQVVVGENDRLTRREASETIASRVPGAALTVVDPGGHLALLEQQEIVNQSIGQLVKRATAHHAAGISRTG
ncbi:MAG TPA: alpha/beta hydrolase [Lacipirellulaceae bacterium]|nr:alpha/beta hydrolase [Lacipirellulaceae bacterium]